VLLLSSVGELYSWGSNSHGQLAHGSTSRPTRVDAFQAFTLCDIGAGDRFSAAVSSDGALFTWGANDSGQLGLGNVGENRQRPGRVGLGESLEREHVLRVACGAAHLLALTRSGAVFAVGDGTSGQLGKGDRERRRIITPVTQLSGVSVRSMAAGARHSLILTADGDVLVSGANDYGQLGLATRFSSLSNSTSPDSFGSAEHVGSPAGVASQVPQMVTTFSPIRSLRGRGICHVACGANHSIALSADGKCFVWGQNQFGQLGLSVDDKVVGVPTLLRIGASERIIGAAGGARHSLFVTVNGAVLAVGQGSAGQLGRSSSSSSASPPFVEGFDGTRHSGASDETDEDMRSRSSSSDNDAAAAADVDLDSVAFEGEEMSPRRRAPRVVPLMPAVDVAAGGMFSLIAMADSSAIGDAAPSDESVRSALVARYERTPIPHLELETVQEMFYAASNERWRAAQVQLLQSADGLSNVAGGRHEWFQTEQAVTVEFYLHKCSVRGATIVADGDAIVVSLLRPAIRIRLVPYAAVSDVVATTMPPTAQASLVDGQLSVVELQAAPSAGRKVVLQLRKRHAGATWPTLEAAAAITARTAAAKYVEKFGKQLTSLLETSFATLASANASFLADRYDGPGDVGLHALDLKGALWFFRRLLVAAELEGGETRANVLETLQRCALDLADQLMRSITNGTPTALSSSSALWSNAMRVIVLLLMAPTTVTLTARAHNTRTWLCTSLSRLASSRRQLLYESLLLPAPKGAVESDADRERVLTGQKVPSEQAAAFGRALSALRRQQEALLSDDAARNERDSFVCARLMSELFAFNEQHALMPRSAFCNATIDRLSEAELLGHYQRWATPGNAQWTFLAHPFMLSLDVKRRVLRIEELIVQQSHIGQAVFTELVSTGQLSETSLRCTIKVRRERVLDDALSQLRLASAEQRLKRPLFVEFEGEAGVDAGGVRKEFFQLALRELLREDYGMFVRNEATGRFWLRPNQLPESAEMFELGGMLIGLALFNSVLLECRFPRALWRKLLAGAELVLSEMSELASVAPEVGRNLQSLLHYTGDVEELDLTFTATQEMFGETKVHDLLSGGANVPVTSRNRERYVQLMVEYLLNGSISAEFAAFSRGFVAAAGGPALKLLSPTELEQLVCGSDDTLFDLSLLRRHARYEGGFDPDSPTVAAFWELVTPSPAELRASEQHRQLMEQLAGSGVGADDDVAALAADGAALADDGQERLTADERRRLLAFMCGSDRVPLGGLEQVRIVLQRNGSDRQRLLGSATCFNTLLLPDYGDDKALLLKNLRIAAEHSQGFGNQ
jgi:ubiquitin-protein ligase E3 A/E3 ubiquitin-protein ligase HERC4